MKNLSLRKHNPKANSSYRRSFISKLIPQEFSLDEIFEFNKNFESISSMKSSVDPFSKAKNNAEDYT